jgi:drug/metabolite transporter (DMT)-like permease
MRRITSWTLLFSCNLMWALQFTCIKLVQDQVGPMFTVWGPMTLATLMLYPLIRAETKEESKDLVPRRDALTYLMLAALGVFPGQVFMTWGTRMSLASNAALINLTLPVTTAIFAFLFLGERMTRVRWVSFSVAIFGVLLCSGIDSGSLDFGARYLAGNILILMATMGSAFYNSYGKKMLRRHSPMRMLFYTYVAMFVIMTPVVFAEERSVFGHIGEFTARTWVGLILLTLFHNYLSMVLFLKALKSLDATQAALSNYLIAFFGLPIAAIWLGERLSTAAIIGGGLVLASTLLITLWPERPAAQERLLPPEIV